MLNLNSLAASPCVISFFLVFFNATSRSLSTWVISSCPSCIPKAWGCQDDISTLLKDDILILLPQIVGQIFFAEVECVHAIIRQVAEEIWLRHASKLGGGADGAKFDTT